MDREKVISELDTQIRWIEEIDAHKFPGWCGATMAMRYAMMLLKEQESVVRCKDCKFFIGEGHYCKIRGMGRALKEDDFCSDGRSVMK